MAQNLLHELYEGIGDAVVDVRQRVVEEAYFGKVVTEREAETPHWPEAREAEPSFGSHTHTREMEPDQGRDMDIDR